MAGLRATAYLRMLMAGLRVAAGLEALQAAAPRLPIYLLCGRVASAAGGGNLHLASLFNLLCAHIALAAFLSTSMEF
jgi:hypothetical protein